MFEKTNDNIKEYKKINFNFINDGKGVLCMNCYHTAYTNNVFLPKHTDDNTLKKIARIGHCPKCGIEFKEVITYKTPKDIAAEKAVTDNYRSEIKYIEELKKSFSYYEGVDPKSVDLRFQPGVYYNTIKSFNIKDTIRDSDFKKYVQSFINLRKYYKHIARKRFMYDLIYDYNDLGLSSGTAAKYQYCTKLQNQLIYTICKSEIFVKYWFTDYSDLIKIVSKFGKKDKNLFAFHVLDIGKTIEEFEFLNYGLAFCDIQYKEDVDFAKLDSMKFIPQYLNKDTESWLRVHSKAVNQFKTIRLGTDDKKEETPVNGGAASYQLTKDMLQEYNQIIAAQRKAEHDLADNPILREMEEEAKQNYKGIIDFLVDD